jgi:hypothetical protein
VVLLSFWTQHLYYPSPEFWKCQGVAGFFLGDEALGYVRMNLLTLFDDRTLRAFCGVFGFKRFSTTGTENLIILRKIESS